MCTQTREPFLVHVLMDAQLDSTLVASEHITERMRTLKTEYHVELANSIQVLSPLQQKRVEDVLNEVYGEMKREERIERLREWDKTNDEIVMVSGKDSKRFIFKSIQIAAQALCNWLPPKVCIYHDEYGIDANSKMVNIWKSGVFNNITSAHILHDTFNNMMACSVVHPEKYFPWSCLIEKPIEPFIGHNFKLPYKLTPQEIDNVFGPRVPTSTLYKTMCTFKNITIQYAYGWNMLFVDIYPFSSSLQ